MKYVCLNWFRPILKNSAKVSNFKSLFIAQWTVNGVDGLDGVHVREPVGMENEWGSDNATTPHRQTEEEIATAVK